MMCLFSEYGTAGNALSIRASVRWLLSLDSLLRTFQSAIANLLTHYGHNFTPFVLIGLGVFIILDSASLTPFVLTVICLILMGLIKTIQSPKIRV